MAKVSVIVPVYNGELYLRQCMDSICNQTLKDIEIICVDDGSTDTSNEILQEYAQRDSRVLVLHQENQYVGAARNNGFRHAAGEYVIFWDCDDFFETDALECMYAQAKKMDADICICKVVRFDESCGIQCVNKVDVNYKWIPKSNLFNRESNEDYILNCTNASVWNKLFRRAFLEQIDLWFPSYRNTEDAYFTWIALCSAQRITTVDKPLVNYRVRSASSVSTACDRKDPTISLQVYCEVAEYLKDHGIFPERSFVNKVLVEVQRVIRKFSVVSNQLKAITYLQENCLNTLCICHRDSEFYYGEEQEKVANHLLSDSPVEFLGFINHETFLMLSIRGMRLNKKDAEVRELRRKLQEIRNPKHWLTRIIWSVYCRAMLVLEKKKF